MLSGSKCTSKGEDLIIWVPVESLCVILETNMRLHTNDTVIKKSYQKLKIEKKIIAYRFSNEQINKGIMICWKYVAEWILNGSHS